MFLSSSLNPLLYVWRIKDIRTGVKQLSAKLAKQMQNFSGIVNARSNSSLKSCKVWNAGEQTNSKLSLTLKNRSKVDTTTFYIFQQDGQTCLRC